MKLTTESKIILMFIIGSVILILCGINVNSFVDNCSTDKSLYILYDDFEGASINTSMWTITTGNLTPRTYFTGTQSLNCSGDGLCLTSVNNVMTTGVMAQIYVAFNDSRVSPLYTFTISNIRQSSAYNTVGFDTLWNYDEGGFKSFGVGHSITYNMWDRINFFIPVENTYNVTITNSTNITANKLITIGGPSLPQKIVLAGNQLNNYVDKPIYFDKIMLWDIATYGYSCPQPAPLGVDRINYLSQNPNDLTAVSLFIYETLNITYSYNNSLLNISTVELLQNINSNVLSCTQYINGSCYAYNTTYTSIAQSFNNTAGTLTNYTFKLRENYIYPYIANRPATTFLNNVHTNYTSNNVNNLISIRFTNISNLTQFNIFEVMATSTGNSKVYACNDTYDFNSDVSTNINCQEIGIIPSTYQHIHNVNSSHVVIPYTVINGRLSNGVRVTETMYFIISGVNTQNTYVSYVNSFTSTGVTKTTSNKGTTWSNQTYTVDAHIHLYSGTETLRYLARGEYSDVLNYTTQRSDLIDVTGLNPQPPIITIPLDTIQRTKYLNISYINASPTIPSITISNYSIFLLNSDLSFNRTIKSYNALNNSYLWDVYNENLTLGIYFIKVVANDTAGLSSFDIESFNLTRNALLNITAYDSISYASVNNLRVNLTNYNTSEIETFNTSGNNLGVDIIKGNYYNIFFDVINYAYNSANYTSNQSNQQFYNVSLSKENSVSINFYDEISGALLINTTCNVTLAGSITSTMYNTTTGNIFLSNLTADGYTATAICTLYTQRQYFITVTDRSTQTLNIYLTQSSTTVLFSYTDKDTGVVLENVLVGLSKMINGTLTLVESRLTDVTGRTQFTVQTNTLYSFVNTKTGYISKTFTLNPVIFTSYNVQLQKEATVTIPLDFKNIAVTYTPNNFVIGNNTFTWTITSPQGQLQEYGFSLTSLCKVIFDTGLNSYGSTFSNNFYLNSSCSNYDTVRLFYYYLDVDDIYRNFTIDLGVTTLGQNASSGNMANTLNSKTYGMGLFERVLITVIITLIIMGVVGMVGGIIGSLAVGLLILGYFVSVGFIPLIVVIITLFVGFVMLASMNKNR